MNGMNRAPGREERKFTAVACSVVYFVTITVYFSISKFLCVYCVFFIVLHVCVIDK